MNYTLPLEFIKINQFITNNCLDYEYERCGYYNYNNEQVYELENNAQDKVNNFELKPEDSLSIFELIESKNRILIWHTHTKHNMKGFSPSDLEQSKKLRLEYYLLNVSNGFIDYFNPNLIEPYEGRIWRYTSSNCYTLVQDYYKKEFNIDLDGFYLLTEKDWEDPNWNMYLENIEKQGFHQASLNNIKKGDLILMKLGRTYNPNHCAIMYDIEQNLILHHIQDKLSTIDIFDDSWRKRVHSVYTLK